ncbi:MAG: hypothetical protein PHV59_08365 [Victivallales bacterium]|nr:hypothetical protein [Victivallales bacterium]
MKNKKIRFFNMIEVLLALTVIAFGMTSILGLFPVGLNASRNAVAQNCSADVADQLVTYLRVTGEIKLTQYANAFYDNEVSGTSYETFATLTNATVNSSGALPTVSGSEKEIYVNTNAESFLKAYGSNRIEDSGTDANKLEAGTIDFVRVASGWSIFKVDLDTSKNKPRTFFIIKGPNCTQNDVLGSTSKISRPVDFSAMALVWKSSVQIWRDKPDGTNWEIWPSFTEGTDPDSTVYYFSGRLNIELSWPLDLPYNERQKRYYQLIINRPPDS